MKERRTPIAGDEDYGNKDWNKKLIRSLGIRRPLLHAYETEFEHPFTGKTILLRAPVPDDMATVMKTLVAENAPIFDPITRYLIGTTEVRGKEAGERGGNKGFVPSDRIAFEDVRVFFFFLFFWFLAVSIAMSEIMHCLMPILYLSVLCIGYFRTKIIG